MWSSILKYGAIAGLVAGGALLVVSLVHDGQPPPSYGMALGFATMLVALSAVFVGIRHYRDRVLGGVVRFWPAFGMGLAMSALAGLCYVAAWELAMALIDRDFAAVFAEMMVERARTQGATGAALAQAQAQAVQFEALYRNVPLRLLMTFAEIFPVGVLVSLVSALVLRNPRVLPAR